MQVKVISGNRVKRLNPKNQNLELRYMFLGQIVPKNAKNEPITLFKASKSVKNKIRKITVNSRRNYLKVPVFDTFYVIIQPFLKISTWNFVHTFISHFHLTYFIFFEILICEETFWKIKKNILKILPHYSISLGKKLQTLSVEPTEHFGIYFGYIRRLFQSWVSPFNTGVRHAGRHSLFHHK